MTASDLNISINNTPLSLPAGPLRTSTLTNAGLPRPYDPGYACTAAYISSITYIDGARGVLRHRGHAISDLVTSVSYDELSYLLLHAALPTARQLSAWRRSLSTPVLPKSVMSVVCAFPKDAHPMAVLMAALSALGAAMPHLNPSVAGNDVYKRRDRRHEAVHTALSLFPGIVAGIHRHLSGDHYTFLPLNTSLQNNLSYTQKFLHLLTGRNSKPKLVAAVEKVLILHADHEQNCSTATVRQLSSSGVDLFSALSGGVAALYGPLHGGACEGVLRMLVRIGRVDAVPQFIARVKRREEKLMGFGHRVYKNYDPRARIVRQIAREVFAIYGKRDPLIDVATRLEKVALSDDYFVKRKLYPNIDFYSGLIYRTMGFKPEFFPVLFALGRVSGWVAHWNEFLDDPDRRIARPHQHFVGDIGPIPIPPMNERGERPKAKL